MRFWKQLVEGLTLQSVYDKGFNAGKNGEPRNMLYANSDTMEIRETYNRGYADGSRTRGQRIIISHE